MNPFGLSLQQQSLLESQAAAAHTDLLLSGQQGSIFHSLVGGRGLDSFSGMTALGGAGLLDPSPSNNNHPARLAGYSSVGAGRMPDISASRHDDIATSLQRMARGQQQFDRSRPEQLDAIMLFPQNFLGAAPTAADQLMLNTAARVQQERSSLMAQRATGIGSLDTATIRPSSRFLVLDDTLLRANVRDSNGGVSRLDRLQQEGSEKLPRTSKAAKEVIRKRARRKIRGSEDEASDSDY
jgi:hypothetical protein